MRGTLYTSYFHRFVHNQDIIKENDVAIIIARNIQSWIPKDLFSGQLKELAPSNELRYKYKDGAISDNEFRRSYIEELCQSRGQRGLDKIREYLDSGKNVYVYCYEKDFNKCHRLPLAMLVSKYGYEVVLR